MRMFGDLADWWDAQRRETDFALDDWVADVGRTHDDFAIVAVSLVATATHTAMDMGAGFVDVLRLGQGVRSGTARGVAQDGLRLLSVAGPAARAPLRLASRALVRLAGPVVETAATSTSGACAWIAAVNALRRTGARHYATVEQMLQAAGINFFTAGQGITDVRRLMAPLRLLGANPTIARGVTSLEALTALLRRQGRRGVAIFGVGWSHPGTQQSVGHALVAFLEGGQLRILDRTGRTVRSLQEVEAIGYQGIGGTPATFAYRGPAAIGPPGSLPSLGWAPDVLFIPEAVPLPGLQLAGSILSAIGFEVQTLLLHSREEAEALLRQRRSVQAGPAIPVQRPATQPAGRRRDGESPF
jgi:hypothetical protein